MKVYTYKGTFEIHTKTLVDHDTILAVLREIERKLDKVGAVYHRVNMTEIGSENWKDVAQR